MTVAGIITPDRRQYIGGSDIGAILGVDRWRTPLDVWREKMGEVPPFEGNADTKRGTTLEPVAAREYSERKGVRLIQQSRPLTHPTHPFLRGHVDRITRGLQPNKIVEIKCPRLGAFSKVKREGLAESYVAQMQFYLGLHTHPAVSGLAGEWVVFCADLWDMLIVPVGYDPALFAQMVERAVHFWREHVQKGVPPTEEQADQLKLAVEAVGGAENLVRRDDIAFAEAVSMLREAKALAAEAETIEDQAKARVKELIGDKPGVYLASGVRLAYTLATGKKSFDRRALAAIGPVDRLKLFSALADCGEAGLAVAESLWRADIALDLSQFETTGKPYTTLRATFFGDDV